MEFEVLNSRGASSSSDTKLRPNLASVSIQDNRPHVRRNCGAVPVSKSGTLTQTDDQTRYFSHQHMWPFKGAPDCSLASCDQEVILGRSSQAKCHAACIYDVVGGPGVKKLAFQVAQLHTKVPSRPADPSSRNRAPVGDFGSFNKSGLHVPARTEVCERGCCGEHSSLLTLCGVRDVKRAGQHRPRGITSCACCLIGQTLRYRRVFVDAGVSRS